MEVDRITVGQSRDGAAVLAHTLRSDEVEVELWSLGARIHDIRVGPAGNRVGIVLNRASVAEYEAPPGGNDYRGAIVGRYANRIAGSSIVIDGRRHTLAPNEGRHQLHGGPKGFDLAVWSAEASVDGDAAVVRFTHRSPAGDQGHPGRLECAAEYRLTGSLLSLEITAQTDAPTVVALTNHAYWNLAGGGSVRHHLLRVPAARVVEVDDELIPTGALRPVAGTPLDFRVPAPLRRAIGAGGIDHCFVIDVPGDHRDSAEPGVVLVDPLSGRSLTVTTDQPGVQIYTGNRLPDPFTAVCIEPGLFPDTPNRPAFGCAVLRPGCTYLHRSEYRFATPCEPGG